MNFYFTYIAIGIGLFVFTTLFVLFAVYAERKVSAFIQDRLGPTETGKFGMLQTLADGLKLIQKELIIPAAADKLRPKTVIPIAIGTMVAMSVAGHSNPDSYRDSCTWGNVRAKQG